MATKPILIRVPDELEALVKKSADKNGEAVAEFARKAFLRELKFRGENVEAVPGVNWGRPRAGES